MVVHSAGCAVLAGCGKVSLDPAEHVLVGGDLESLAPLLTDERSAQKLVA
jgi:hypothetical protein